MDQQLLSRFPFLADASANILAQLDAYGRRIQLPAGHLVCVEGDQCTHMPLLLSGSVRVHKIGESGREITLYRLGPGDSCILTASCIIGERPFPAHAIVEEATEACVIPSSVFRDWVARHREWREYVFKLLSDRLADVISVIDEITFRRLDVRLAKHILLSVGAGETNTLRTTHEALASDLGSSREVVSRLLKEFEREGLVVLSRGCLTVRNAEGLGAIANRR